jgi:hypothetical protein
VLAVSPAAALPPGPPPSLIPDGGVPVLPIPPAFPPAMPWIDYGARMHMSLRATDHADPARPNSLRPGTTIDGDIYMSGAIHRMFKWQAGVTVAYNNAPGSPAMATIQPLDIIARFEPMPEFNIYAGRLIHVADRFMTSGPWGADEYNVPGIYPGIPSPVLPKTNSVGRDVGFNIWGALFGGHFKYYAGAYQLHDPAINPLLTGRLQVSLLSPEPAFYQRTTYYGTRDLVSLGVGGQYQAGGSTVFGPPAMMGGAPTVAGLDDHTYFNVDLDVEKVLDAGTISVVGSYQMFGGDGQFWDNGLHLGVGWLFPQLIGVGKIRPNLRFQMANPAAEGGDASTMVEAQLSYIIAAWYARVNIGYRRASVWANATSGKVNSNMIWLGIVLADP